MYVPRHFAMPQDDALRALAQARFGTLVTVADGVPHATPLPVLYDADAGELGSVLLHVARPNDQWRHTGEGLLLIDGPDAYISPLWYATTPSVPTWNYATLQVRGRLVPHDDPGWLRAVVARLSDRHETRWSVDALDERFVAGQLRAIVGIELVVTEVVGKLKAGQNRSVADIEGAIAGLGSEGHADDDAAAMADLMGDQSLPHARAREQVVREVREGRRQ